MYKLISFAACFALCSLALAVSSPPIWAIGLALFALAVFPSGRLRFVQHHPRSIFETRRAGLI